MVAACSCELSFETKVPLDSGVGARLEVRHPTHKRLLGATGDDVTTS